MNFAIVGCKYIVKKHKRLYESKVANLSLFAIECYRRWMSIFQNTEQNLMKICQICDDPSIDVVNICTSSGFHVFIVVEAAKTGKHLIVEKPIVLTLEDVNRIIRVCKENNVKLAVVHPKYFCFVVQDLRKLMMAQLLNCGLIASLSWSRIRFWGWLFYTWNNCVECMRAFKIKKLSVPWH